MQNGEPLLVVRPLFFERHPMYFTGCLQDSARDVLDHFTARFGTLAALYSTLGHVSVVWKLLAFGTAVVTCLSTGLADDNGERPLACGQACRNAAYFGTVITKLHTRGVFFVSVGDKMRTMPVTLVALSHAL